MALDNVRRIHCSTEEKEDLRRRLDNCLTKTPLSPNELVKADEYALSVFNETALLMEKLGRADALFNLTLNRLALKTSELRQIEVQKSKIMELIDALDTEDKKDVKTYNSLLKSYNELVKSSNTISQLLLNMEKELSLTVNTTQRCKLTVPESSGADLSKYIIN